jgi:hypothetical protein
MISHGLERRFAFYDSHNIEGLLHPRRGALQYFRGDVIHVLRRCNDTWALGQVRGNLGLFPLEHTCSGNFLLTFSNYIAKTSAEISVNRGQVVPITLTPDPARYHVYSSTEYGLVPWQHFAPLRPPPVRAQEEHAWLYYQYTPLDRGQIRLIYITPKNIQDFLASGKQSLFLTLEHVPLSKAPTYVAFSYCWGDPSDKTPVFCNEKLLYVPSSLWRVLRRYIPGEDKDVVSNYDQTLSYGERKKAIFWADAVCINQRDTIEKNHQIPLMQTIYSRASEVLVYVGETDCAMATTICLESIAIARQRNPSLGVIPRDTLYEIVGRVDWDTVQRFFSQPIFRRSWVIQEIILSREPTICYGMTQLTLSRIHDCTLALSENHIRPAHYIPGDIAGNREDMDMFTDGIRQLSNLSRLKAIWDQGGIVPFIEILRQFRSAQATDPRDKVYSLLSLAAEEYRRSIRPNYSPSNSTVDVYKHVARCAIQFSDLKRLLPNAGISRRNPSLPSWVPDWSYEPREVINGSLFSCSGSKTEGDAYILPFDSSNWTKLVIRGAIIDKVSRTCPRWTPNGEREFPDIPLAEGFGNVPTAVFLADRIIRLGYMAMDKCGRYPNGDSISTALWQTLTCGMIRGEHRAMPSDEIHFDAFLECYRDALKYRRSVMFPGIEGRRVERNDVDLNVRLENLSLAYGLGSLGSGTNEPNVPGSGRDNHGPLVEERVLPFFKTLIRYQAGRRTCVTEKFHLAAVPDEAEEGDVIAIFFGHALPYVLRRMESPDARPDQFQLLGHCYVHGIMDGELVETSPAGGAGAAIRGANALYFVLA